MVIPGMGNNFCLTTADVFNTMGRVCGPAADNNTEELIGGKHHIQENMTRICKMIYQMMNGRILREHSLR